MSNDAPVHDSGPVVTSLYSGARDFEEEKAENRHYYEAAAALDALLRQGRHGPENATERTDISESKSDTVVVAGYATQSDFLDLLGGAEAVRSLHSGLAFRAPDALQQATKGQESRTPTLVAAAGAEAKAADTAAAAATLQTRAKTIATHSLTWGEVEELAWQTLLSAVATSTAQLAAQSSKQKSKTYKWIQRFAKILNMPPGPKRREAIVNYDAAFRRSAVNLTRKVVQLRLGLGFSAPDPQHQGASTMSSAGSPARPTQVLEGYKELEEAKDDDLDIDTDSDMEEPSGKSSRNRNSASGDDDDDDEFEEDLDAEVREAGVGGIAGGVKYIGDGILLKFAEDPKVGVDSLGRPIYLYGGDKPDLRSAGKAASNDLKGANAYFGHFYENGIPVLVPIQVVLDAMGYRVVAMPLLPIGRAASKIDTVGEEVTDPELKRGIQLWWRAKLFEVVDNTIPDLVKVSIPNIVEDVAKATIRAWRQDKSYQVTMLNNVRRLWSTRNSEEPISGIDLSSESSGKSAIVTVLATAALHKLRLVRPPPHTLPELRKCFEQYPLNDYLADGQKSLEAEASSSNMLLSAPHRPASGIIYGTGDGGINVHNDDVAASAFMRHAAVHGLHLAEHSVRGVLIASAGDVECHIGGDGRYYLIDLARAFPPEFARQLPHLPPLKGAVFVRTLRAEFLTHLKRLGLPAISPDAFTGFADRNAPNHRVLTQQAALATRALVTQMYTVVRGMIAGVVADGPDYMGYADAFVRQTQPFVHPRIYLTLRSAARARSAHSGQLNYFQVATKIRQRLYRFHAAGNCTSDHGDPWKASIPSQLEAHVARLQWLNQQPLHSHLHAAGIGMRHLGLVKSLAHRAARLGLLPTTEVPVEISQTILQWAEADEAVGALLATLVQSLPETQSSSHELAEKLSRLLIARIPPLFVEPLRMPPRLLSLIREWHQASESARDLWQRTRSAIVPTASSRGEVLSRVPSTHFSSSDGCNALLVTHRQILEHKAGESAELTLASAAQSVLNSSEDLVVADLTAAVLSRVDPSPSQRSLKSFSSLTIKHGGSQTSHDSQDAGLSKVKALDSAAQAELLEVYTQGKRQLEASTIHPSYQQLALQDRRTPASAAGSSAKEPDAQDKQVTKPGPKLCEPPKEVQTISQVCPTTAMSEMECEASYMVAGELRSDIITRALKGMLRAYMRTYSNSASESASKTTGGQRFAQYLEQFVALVMGYSQVEGDRRLQQRNSSTNSPTSAPPNPSHETPWLYLCENPIISDAVAQRKLVDEARLRFEPLRYRTNLPSRDTLEVLSKSPDQIDSWEWGLDDGVSLLMESRALAEQAFVAVLSDPAGDYDGVQTDLSVNPGKIPRPVSCLTWDEVDIIPDEESASKDDQTSRCDPSHSTQLVDGFGSTLDDRVVRAFARGFVGLKHGAFPGYRLDSVSGDGPSLSQLIGADASQPNNPNVETDSHGELRDNEQAQHDWEALNRIPWPTQPKLFAFWTRAVPQAIRDYFGEIATREEDVVIESHRRAVEAIERHVANLVPRAARRADAIRKELLAVKLKYRAQIKNSMMPASGAYEPEAGDMTAIDNPQHFRALSRFAELDDVCEHSVTSLLATSVLMVRAAEKALGITMVPEGEGGSSSSDEPITVEVSKTPMHELDAVPNLFTPMAFVPEFTLKQTAALTALTYAETWPLQSELLQLEAEVSAWRRRLHTARIAYVNAQLVWWRAATCSNVEFTWAETPRMLPQNSRPLAEESMSPLRRLYGRMGRTDECFYLEKLRLSPEIATLGNTRASSRGESQSGDCKTGCDIISGILRTDWPQFYSSERKSGRVENALASLIRSPQLTTHHEEDVLADMLIQFALNNEPDDDRTRTNGVSNLEMTFRSTRTLLRATTRQHILFDAALSTGEPFARMAGLVPSAFTEGSDGGARSNFITSIMCAPARLCLLSDLFLSDYITVRDEIAVFQEIESFVLNKQRALAQKLEAVKEQHELANDQEIPIDEQTLGLTQQELNFIKMSSQDIRQVVYAEFTKCPRAFQVSKTLSDSNQETVPIPLGPSLAVLPLLLKVRMLNDIRCLNVGLSSSRRDKSDGSSRSLRPTRSDARAAPQIHEPLYLGSANETYTEGVKVGCGSVLENDHDMIHAQLSGMDVVLTENVIFGPLIPSKQLLFGRADAARVDFAEVETSRHTSIVAGRVMRTYTEAGDAFIHAPAAIVYMSRLNRQRCDVGDLAESISPIVASARNLLINFDGHILNDDSIIFNAESLGTEMKEFMLVRNLTRAELVAEWHVFGSDVWFYDHDLFSTSSAMLASTRAAAWTDLCTQRFGKFGLSLQDIRTILFGDQGKDSIGSRATAKSASSGDFQELGAKIDVDALLCQKAATVTEPPVIDPLLRLACGVSLLPRMWAQGIAAPGGFYLPNEMPLSQLAGTGVEELADQIKAMSTGTTKTVDDSSTAEHAEDEGMQPASPSIDRESVAAVPCPASEIFMRLLDVAEGVSEATDLLKLRMTGVSHLLNQAMYLWFNHGVTTDLSHTEVSLQAICPSLYWFFTNETHAAMRRRGIQLELLLQPASDALWKHLPMQAPHPSPACTNPPKLVDRIGVFYPWLVPELGAASDRLDLFLNSTGVETLGANTGSRSAPIPLVKAAHTMFTQAAMDAISQITGVPEQRLRRRLRQRMQVHRSSKLFEDLVQRIVADPSCMHSDFELADAVSAWFDQDDISDEASQAADDQEHYLSEILIHPNFGLPRVTVAQCRQEGREACYKAAIQRQCGKAMTSHITYGEYLSRRAGLSRLDSLETARTSSPYERLARGILRHLAATSPDVPAHEAESRVNDILSMYLEQLKSFYGMPGERGVTEVSLSSLSHELPTLEIMRNSENSRIYTAYAHSHEELVVYLNKIYDTERLRRLLPWHPGRELDLHGICWQSIPCRMALPSRNFICQAMEQFKLTDAVTLSLDFADLFSPSAQLDFIRQKRPDLFLHGGSIDERFARLCQARQMCRDLSKQLKASASVALASIAYIRMLSRHSRETEHAMLVAVPSESCSLRARVSQVLKQTGVDLPANITLAPEAVSQHVTSVLDEGRFHVRAKGMLTIRDIQGIYCLDRAIDAGERIGRYIVSRAAEDGAPQVSKFGLILRTLSHEAKHIVPDKHSALIPSLAQPENLLQKQGIDLLQSLLLRETVFRDILNKVIRELERRQPDLESKGVANDVSTVVTELRGVIGSVVRAKALRLTRSETRRRWTKEDITRAVARITNQLISWLTHAPGNSQRRSSANVHDLQNGCVALASVMGLRASPQKIACSEFDLKSVQNLNSLGKRATLLLTAPQSAPELCTEPRTEIPLVYATELAKYIQSMARTFHDIAGSHPLAIFARVGQALSATLTRFGARNPPPYDTLEAEWAVEALRCGTCLLQQETSDQIKLGAYRRALAGIQASNDNDGVLRITRLSEEYEQIGDCGCCLCFSSSPEVVGALYLGHNPEAATLRALIHLAAVDSFISDSLCNALNTDRYELARNVASRLTRVLRMRVVPVFRSDVRKDTWMRSMKRKGSSPKYEHWDLKSAYDSMRCADGEDTGSTIPVWQRHCLYAQPHVVFRIDRNSEVDMDHQHPSLRRSGSLKVALAVPGLSDLLNLENEASSLADSRGVSRYEELLESGLVVLKAITLWHLAHESQRASPDRLETEEWLWTNNWQAFAMKSADMKTAMILAHYGINTISMPATEPPIVPTLFTSGFAHFGEWALRELPSQESIPLRITPLYRWIRPQLPLISQFLPSGLEISAAALRTWRFLELTRTSTTLQQLAIAPATARYLLNVLRGESTSADVVEARTNALIVALHASLRWYEAQKTSAHVQPMHNSHGLEDLIHWMKQILITRLSLLDKTPEKGQSHQWIESQGMMIVYEKGLFLQRLGNGQQSEHPKALEIHNPSAVTLEFLRKLVLFGQLGTLLPRPGGWPMIPCSRRVGGYSAIASAVQAGNEVALRLLLARGANPNDINCLGGSDPVYLAVSLIQPPHLRLLLAYGGVIEHESLDGSPLVSALTRLASVEAKTEQNRVENDKVQKARLQTSRSGGDPSLIPDAPTTPTGLKVRPSAKPIDSLPDHIYNKVFTRQGTWEDIEWLAPIGLEEYGASQFDLDDDFPPIPPQPSSPSPWETFLQEMDSQEEADSFVSDCVEHELNDGMDDPSLLEPRQEDFFVPRDFVVPPKALRTRFLKEARNEWNAFFASLFVAKVLPEDFISSHPMLQSGSIFPTQIPDVCANGDGDLRDLTELCRKIATQLPAAYDVPSDLRVCICPALMPECATSLNAAQQSLQTSITEVQEMVGSIFPNWPKYGAAAAPRLISIIRTVDRLRTLAARKRENPEVDITTLLSTTPLPDDTCNVCLGKLRDTLLEDALYDSGMEQWESFRMLLHERSHRRKVHRRVRLLAASRYGRELLLALAQRALYLQASPLAPAFRDSETTSRLRNCGYDLADVDIERIVTGDPEALRESSEIVEGVFRANEWSYSTVRHLLAWLDQSYHQFVRVASLLSIPIRIHHLENCAALMWGKQCNDPLSKALYLLVHASYRVKPEPQLILPPSAPARVESPAECLQPVGPNWTDPTLPSKLLAIPINPKYAALEVTGNAVLREEVESSPNYVVSADWLPWRTSATNVVQGSEQKLYSMIPSVRRAAKRLRDSSSWQIAPVGGPMTDAVDASASDDYAVRGIQETVFSSSLPIALAAVVREELMLDDVWDAEWPHVPALDSLDTMTGLGVSLLNAGYETKSPKVILSLLYAFLEREYVQDYCEYRLYKLRNQLAKPIAVTTPSTNKEAHGDLPPPVPLCVTQSHWERRLFGIRSIWNTLGPHCIGANSRFLELEPPLGYSSPFVRLPPNPDESSPIWERKFVIPKTMGSASRSRVAQVLADFLLLGQGHDGVNEYDESDEWVEDDDFHQLERAVRALEVSSLTEDAMEIIHSWSSTEKRVLAPRRRLPIFTFYKYLERACEGRPLGPYSEWALDVPSSSHALAQLRGALEDIRLRLNEPLKLRAIVHATPEERRILQQDEVKLLPAFRWAVMRVIRKDVQCAIDPFYHERPTRIKRRTPKQTQALSSEQIAIAVARRVMLRELEESGDTSPLNASEVYKLLCVFNGGLACLQTSAGISALDMLSASNVHTSVLAALIAGMANPNGSDVEKMRALYVTVFPKAFARLSALLDSPSQSETDVKTSALVQRPGSSTRDPDPLAPAALRQNASVRKALLAWSEWQGPALPPSLFPVVQRANERKKLEQAGKGVLSSGVLASPLFFAAQFNNPEVAALIMLSGANSAQIDRTNLQPPVLRAVEAVSSRLIYCFLTLGQRAWEVFASLCSATCVLY